MDRKLGQRVKEKGKEKEQKEEESDDDVKLSLSLPFSILSPFLSILSLLQEGRK
jgi:hypothetical protein